MEKSLSPETIYASVKSNQTSKTIAVDQLISLIEGSNNSKTRSESISTLNKLKVSEPRVFKIIENSLLSDESQTVRKSAVDLLGAQYLRNGIETLTWVVRHDKSPLVINAILDLNLRLGDARLKSLKKEIDEYLERIALTIGMKPNLF
jgi:HEAT repeat protein